MGPKSTRSKRTASARGAPPGPEITYYPNDGDHPATLSVDPTRFAVTFSPERIAMSDEGLAVLREHAAPVGQVRHYGLRIYQADSTAARERAVRVLDAEQAVEFATPVLRRDGRDVYLTRRFVVQFRPEVSRGQVEELNERYEVEIVEPLGYARNGFLLEAPRGGLQAVELANAYRETGLVVFAHPDLISQRHKRSGTITPGNPAAQSVEASDISTGRASEAPAERDSSYLSRQWHLRSARVVDAWSITRGSRDISIALMDDGVDTAHPEFAARIGAQADFADDVSDGRPKHADDNHGTACAGVAAAGGVRASGAAPGCTLMPIRFPATLGDADEAEMFRWAADEGAGVISCSWGPPDGTGSNDPLPGATKAAISYCVNDHGIPVLFAAGNGNESIDLDGYASNPDVMAIAACTNADQHSWYSDTGTAVSVCAPSNGGDLAILTTDRSGGAGYNPGTANLAAGYTDTFGGTSSATPLVAGVVGLIRSVNPDLNPAEIRQILEDTADKIGGRASYDANGHRPDFGHGKINAAAAVRSAQTGTSGSGPARSDGSISAFDASVARGGPAPRFEVDPGSGSAVYYAVEVATDAARFDGGGRNAGNFYASYEHGPLQASSPWTLPAEAWAALQAAPALYYRAWFSSSPSDWVDYSVTLVSSLPIGPTGTRSRRRLIGSRPQGPEILGPESVPRAGPAPDFHLHLAGDRYFAVEVARDVRIFDRTEDTPLDPAAFYGTWQEGAGEADRDVDFTLPETAWRSLRSAEVLFYRILTASTPPTSEGWTDIRASTPDQLAERAPYFVVTDAPAGLAGVERDGTGPRVLDPDELLWRQPANSR
jgi:subtilisin family serine protease